MSESSVLVEHPVLTVECGEAEDGVRRAALIGDLDLATAGLVEEAVAGLIAREGVAGVVLDLEHLDFMSSTGVAMLIRLRMRAAERGKELAIGQRSAQVRRLFAIAGIDDAFGLAGPEGS